MVKNYSTEINNLRRQFPQEWKDAHTGNSRTEDFVRIVAWELHKLDARIGLNGKRGNPEDISDDALSIRDPEGFDFDPTWNNDKRSVIDFIGAAGSSGAFVTWSNVSRQDAPTGSAWVMPKDPKKTSVTPVPVPVPKLKNRDQFYKELQELNDFYASFDGLQRYGGMIINGRADVEALGSWGYDLMMGSTVEECKAKIRLSLEWRSKH